MNGSITIPMDGELTNIKKQIEAIADQLCIAVSGNFDFSIKIYSSDESIQKLSMLMNFVIDAARRALSSMQEQNAKLTELDKLKSDFMSTISHELRTPLTLIMGPLETILDNIDSIPEQHTQNIQRMHRNAMRLYILVNDVLDFSKLEAGKYEVHEELIDLNKLLSYLVEDAMGLAKERKITLKFTNLANEQLLLLDQKMIEKIAMNLIGNALKFTPEHGQIDVILKREGENISLSVKDTGIGIPKENIKQLFERFHQIDSSTTRAHEGTGIGLAIVYQFTTLMKGKVFVESEPGQGATFTVTLPAKTAPQDEITTKSGALKASPLTKPIKPSFSALAHKMDATEKSVPLQQIKIEGKMPLILVAEDNEDMRAYIVSLLKDIYEIITANNGEAALHMIHQYHPQVILSDVMMPIMNGYQLTQVIKTDPKVKHIPIILITAKSGKGAVENALGIGADDYLSKPFSSQELKARLNSALRIYNDYMKLLELNKELDKSNHTLEIANSKLSEEIVQRKKAEAENRELTNQLVIASRHAGMADTATSVLHNIGNVLNSVNTSISMIGEKINHSKMSTLSELNHLLEQHQNDIVTFITTDPKGKHLPNYIMKLSGTWGNEKSHILEEVHSLQKNVQHINEIITQQNSLSTSASVIEKVDALKLIEDALVLAQAFNEDTQIKVLREFSPIKEALIDRVKLLQIVVNLIKNSIDALRESKNNPKFIKIITKEKDPLYFIIQVADNGVGIGTENKKNIFTHGFTTKKTGHGFGLHASAIAVQEMGGNLTFESNGNEQGTTFSITLPYQSTKIKGDKHVSFQPNADFDH